MAPLTLTCALLASDSDSGIFSVAVEPTQLVTELKGLIKRKKPHALRYWDADRLTLFLATSGGRWLSDEHEAVLQLERGHVHDDLRDIVECGAELRATKPLAYYLQNGTLSPPEPEQLHLLVLLPSGATKRPLATSADSGSRHKKIKREEDEENLVIIIDSEDEDYVDPPRPLADPVALFRRMGKEFVPVSDSGNDSDVEDVTHLFIETAPVVMEDPGFEVAPETEDDLTPASAIEEAVAQPEASDSVKTEEEASPPLEFTAEQNEFIRLAVQERRNLLLVAPAGYGKSAVIKTTIDVFHSTLPSVNRHTSVGLCAPTGKAASLIGGRTIHSYLGIGMARGPVKDWVRRMRTSSFLKTTLKALIAVQVIIIDEISMVSAQFLDKISQYLQALRKDPRPFGGVQMILLGDLCQLPPVQGAFMFRSVEYARAQFKACRFTKCFRQNDPAFVAMLNKVRFGECSDTTFATLAARTSIDPEYANGLKPMVIMSTNAEVDMVNDRELYKLSHDHHAEILTYCVRVSPYADPRKAEAYRKADGIPKQVKLTVGCEVVVTQNMGNGLVNGSQGCVISADSQEIVLRLQDDRTATVEFFAYTDPEEPDEYLARTLFSYLPVRLGYASTVHKAQGMTLQLLEVDLKRIFAHGQLYTAVSRVTDLRGLLVKNLTRRAFICHDTVRDFYARLS